MSSCIFLFDDDNDSEEVHPFSYEWTLSVWKSDREKEWTDCIYRQTSINTIEQFWALIHRIVAPSQLSLGIDYMFFKGDIQPMWEDKRNANGGMWCIDVEKQYRHTKLDRYWICLLEAMLGENFGLFSAYVNGVIVNNRGRGSRICLWVNDVKANDPEMREMIDAKLKLTTTDRLYFKRHAMPQH